MGNHRADPRQRRSTAPTPAGGRRKADTRAARVRRPSFALGVPARVPALPTFIGAAVLVVAAGGAVVADQLPQGAGLELAAGSRLPGGTDAYAFHDASRVRAVSRDSERQALQDAASRHLQNEAEQQSAQRSAALAQLARHAEERASEIAKNQWHLPTVGYQLTGRFGMTSGLWATFHTGLDFAAPEGTPIFAVANGVITSTGWDGPYGNRTVETLPDGTEIWYAHQSAIDVHPGDTVTGGQLIGRIGSTGNTTGPHVHIEVRPGGGDPVDPYEAFIQHGVHP
ncbi:MAG: M23 family metallopeptidase [Marmoricola sp.]